MRAMIGVVAVLVLVVGFCRIRPKEPSPDVYQPRVTFSEVAVQMEHTFEVTQAYMGQQRDAACQHIRPQLAALEDQLQELAPPARAAWGDLQVGFTSAFHELWDAFRNAVRRFQD